MLDPIVDAWQWRLGVTLTVGDVTTGGPGETDLRSGRTTVSRHLTPFEARCTKMHEFAHLVLPPPVDPTPEQEVAYEDACDEWAARELIPDVLYERAIAQGRDERERAEICGVDEGIWAAARRLHPARPAQVIRLA